jgi:broad specificity phosphatase PhoE
MTTICLLRHGETEWNREGNRYCGRTDVALAPTGRDQARLVAAVLRDVPFAAASCSTLQRSRETAEIIAAGRDLPIVADPRLMERDFGRWEGMTPAEIERDNPDYWARYLQDPATTRPGQTGETAAEVAARGRRCLADLAAAYPTRTVLVVGHSTLNRLVIAASLGLPLRHYRRLVQGNTGISVAILEPDGTAVWERINETAHLRLGTALTP